MFQPASRYVLTAEGVASLDGRTPPAGNQAAQPSIAGPVDGKRDPSQSALEAKLRADEQLQLQQLRRHVCPDNSGNGALISDGERSIAQGAGAVDELLWVRSAA
jgi:hypothetical protein